MTEDNKSKPNESLPLLKSEALEKGKADKSLASDCVDTTIASAAAAVTLNTNYSTFFKRIC